MYALLVLIGIFGVPISLILLVIAAIRKRPKKKFGIAILVCFIALIVGVILAPPVESSSQRKSTSSTSQQDTGSRESTSSTSQQDTGSAETTKKEETNTENTSSKVDSIARQARDAANAATATMEQMMYYGWLLEYKYVGNPEKEDYCNLGQDAEQLVKYVYRGTDTTDSDHSKSNIEQIRKSIDAIEQAKAAAATQAAAEQSETSNSSDTASSKENSRTVYITKTGKKYHYANPCGKGTYYPCSLAEAQSRGLEPCGKCVLR